MSSFVACIPGRRRSPTAAVPVVAVALVSLIHVTARADGPRARVVDPELPPPVDVTAWEPGQPIPFGYHAERKVRRGLVITGATLFGTTYVLTAFLSIEASRGGPGAIGAIPIGGPFGLLYLVNKPSPYPTDDNCSCAAIFTALLVLDGIAQAAGAGMLIAGLVGKPVLAPNVYTSKVQVVPMPLRFGRSGGGIGLAGTF